MVFADNTSRKHMWVANYVMLILWGLLWILSYIVRSLPGHSVKHADHAATANNNHTGSGLTANEHGVAHTTYKHPLHWRSTSATRIAQTSFLMAFAATVFTEFGYGATRAPEALLWAFFALTIVHTIAGAFVRNAAVPVVLGLPQVILIVIIVGLSFRD
ncbi:hypothetical protein DFS34DRAFT_647696 [Phlyctochytrium arcticum]|nr:hypothetical protein DFS34DRAFT_647696 [Phlyctochytrium arcticum]